MKSLTLIDVSKSTWYLKRSDSKSELTTSSALSYNINSILLLFVCITHSSSSSSSSSLEEIMLIAIFNWILHVSDFWRLIIIEVCFNIFLSILLLIDLYFYHHYFHIQYNCCCKIYLHLLLYDNHLFV